MLSRVSWTLAQISCHCRHDGAPISRTRRRRPSRRRRSKFDPGRCPTCVSMTSSTDIRSTGRDASPGQSIAFPHGTQKLTGATPLKAFNFWRFFLAEVESATFWGLAASGLAFTQLSLLSSPGFLDIFRGDFGTRDVSTNGISTPHVVSPQSDLRRRAASRWALPQSSSFFAATLPRENLQ